jgi:hypothetical protein
VRHIRRAAHRGVLHGSPGEVAVSVLFGGIGFVAFRYGRKMQRVSPVVLGMALMTPPLFVRDAGWLAAIGVCLASGLWLWRD